MDNSRSAGVRDNAGLRNRFAVSQFASGSVVANFSAGDSHASRIRQSVGAKNCSHPLFPRIADCLAVRFPSRCQSDNADWLAAGRMNRYAIKDDAI